MARRHTEEAVLPILQRKGLYVNPLTKQIGVQSELQIGIRILGKLDFIMKVAKWQVVKNASKTDVGLGGNASQQYAKKMVNNSRWADRPVDPMKENLKKKKTFSSNFSKKVIY